MGGTSNQRRASFALLVVLLAGPLIQTSEKPPSWSAASAASYLEDRQRIWFDQAKCVSCHTVLPFALAHPVLRQRLGDRAPSEQQTKLLTQIRRRVANWEHLDTEEFGLYYDSSPILKTQSWGTEAVFNAVILAYEDRSQGKSSPSKDTRQAFAQLWQTQVKTGSEKGSWEWLDFNEPPWGDKASRYVGAALAAVAIGTAPGYHTPGADADLDARVEALRDYLKARFPRENLHNRTWGLWAATKIDGLLSQAEHKTLSEQLLARQLADGGWSLVALGPWSRNGGVARENTADGYATALVLHVLQSAGASRDHKQIAKGLDWLKSRQDFSGSWSSLSLIKKRDPATHSGKFMSDAATAFAVLALSH